MFIELEKESRLIFEKYFNFTTYKFRYGGEEHIEYSKDQKLLEFSKTIFNMIKELKNIFKDKPIGIIRSNNI